MLSLLLSLLVGSSLDVASPLSPLPPTVFLFVTSVFAALFF